MLLIHLLQRLLKGCTVKRHLLTIGTAKHNQMTVCFCCWCKSHFDSQLLKNISLRKTHLAQ